MQRRIIYCKCTHCNIHSLFTISSGQAPAGSLGPCASGARTDLVSPILDLAASRCARRTNLLPRLAGLDPVPTVGARKTQNRSSRAPHRHPSLFSRAKPRDLKRLPALTTLFTNPLVPPHRRAGKTRYPRCAGRARLPPTRHPPTSPSLLPKRNVGALGRGRPWGAGRGYLPHTHDPFTTPRYPPLYSSYRGHPVPTVGRGRAGRIHRPPQSPDVIPNPFTVIPSEAEGPETAAGPDSTFHERTRPPSCRGHPVPTGRGWGDTQTTNTQDRQAHTPTSLVLPDSDPLPTSLSSSPTPIGDPRAQPHTRHPPVDTPPPIPLS